MEAPGESKLLSSRPDMLLRHSVLSSDDEKSLAKQIEAGLFATHLLEDSSVDTKSHTDASREELEQLAELGSLAMKTFIQSNQRLVADFASRHTNWSGDMTFSDLVQEGNVELVKLVENFDYKHGFKFSTYAARGLAGAIKRSVVERGSAIRIPEHRFYQMNDVLKGINELSQNTGKLPSLVEVAEKIGQPVNKIESTINLWLDAQVSSYNQPIDSAESVGSEMVDLIEDSEAVSPEDSVAQAQWNREVAQALSELSPREEYIIRRHYGLGVAEPQTLAEIAKDLHVSAERVRQLRNLALATLRDSLSLRASEPSAYSDILK